MSRATDDPHAHERIYREGEPLASAQAAVIFIHGRGAPAKDILGLAEHFDLPGVAFLAPEAADRTWYPYSFLALMEQNLPWLDSALRFIRRVVSEATGAGIPLPKIAFVGFSQGACLSSEFIARNPAHYGGLIALSGGLIGPPGTKFNYSGILSGTACLLGCGDADPHIPWERVAESAEVLSSMGASVNLRRYPGMPHTINEDEIDHAREILERLGTK
jgi:phospholipase/carboxylesterase